MDPVDLVNIDKVVELTKTLIAFPSVSGEEHNLVDWLENYFQYIGLEDIERHSVEEAGDTLTGWINGPEDGPTLMLNFHIDTFNAFKGWETDPFEPVVKNRRIYGLGAHDMKGGAACLLSAVEAVINSNIELGGSLLVSATTDEENWSRGIHTLIEKGILEDVDYCIVPEQSITGTITVGQLGRHVFHIDFYGKAVHAVFEGGINAVTDASRVALEVEKIKDLGYMAEYDKRGSICVTGLQGGGSDILVPEHAELWIDRHILPNQTTEDAAKQIHEAVKRAKIESKYKITWDNRPTPAPTSYITPPDSNLVQTVTKVLEEFSGKEVNYIIETSVADTNHIAVHGKVPTIILGPHGGNTCEANEWVDISSMLTVAQTLVGATTALLNNHE